MYLACKVEEFYVAIGQFVSNLKGNREKFADTILAFELLLMSKLQYHLTIHHPYRPLEGLLIDIKVVVILFTDYLHPQFVKCRKVCQRNYIDL